MVYMYTRDRKDTGEERRCTKKEKLPPEALM
jgi:hypothetical protein